MIIGIGTDIVHLPRIARILAQRETRFLARAFHPDEIMTYRQRLQSTRSDSAVSLSAVRFVASRWAAKESVYKALGGQWRIPFPDIWIRQRDGDAKPEIALVNDSAVRASALGVAAWHVSLSHDGEYAIAMVIAQGQHPFVNTHGP